MDPNENGAVQMNLRVFWKEGGGVPLYTTPRALHPPFFNLVILSLRFSPKTAS